MAYNLLSCERDQSYLMPPSMRDCLSEVHLAWLIAWLQSASWISGSSMQAIGLMDGVHPPTTTENDADDYAVRLLHGCNARSQAHSPFSGGRCRIPGGGSRSVSQTLRTICRFRPSAAEAFEELFVRGTEVVPLSGSGRSWA